MIRKTAAKSKLELTGWMNIANPDMSFEQAKQKMIELGNKIIEEDPVNRRFKVVQEIL